jgi:hypothetical protein
MGDFHDELEEAVLKKLREMGVALQEDIQKHCPVKTGRLRSSWTTKKMKDRVRVGTNVKYAIHVEYVHSLPPVKMWPAKEKRGGTGPDTLPFIRPALDRLPEKLKAIANKPLN